MFAVKSIRLPLRRMITLHAAVFSSHGEPAEVLRTHTYEIDEHKLSPNAVIVKTLAAPVNPSDINQIQGVYPSQPEKTTQLGTLEPSAVAGNEGVFEVLHVGSKVEGLKVGDWAIPTNVNFGTWRTHAECDAADMMHVPSPASSEGRGKKALSKNSAATLSVNPLTAYLLLTHYVKLGKEDWVIQNGGLSAVGKYVAQMSRILGINLISVVRDRPNFDEFAAYLKDLGASQVISEKENNSREFKDVKKWVAETGGEIKLAFNCVGGKSLAGVARKLAPNGLMLTYGGMSLQPVTLPTSLHIFKNITSAGFWVTQLLKDNAGLKRKTVDQVVEWYEDGKLADQPAEEVLAGDVAETFKASIKASKTGKQLVVFE